MWYFSWILGVLLACSLGIINVLRLETLEALDKENVAIDPLTHLLVRESVLENLKEKVDNSKRNGMPFALLYLSLTHFKKKHHLPEHEMDTTILKVAASIKKDIRDDLDIAARIGEDDFLLAVSGASLDKAETIANKIKRNIFKNVKTPGDIFVEIDVGVAEYAQQTDFFSEQVVTGGDEVEALLNIAVEKCYESNIA